MADPRAPPNDSKKEDDVLEVDGESSTGISAVVSISEKDEDETVGSYIITVEAAEGLPVPNGE